MRLYDELFKLYITVKDPKIVRYRRHPCQLRIVAKANSMWISQGRLNVGALSAASFDKLIARHYID